MAWSAVQYMKFEDERTRPARDLLGQVPSLPEGPLYDLGCGPGNSTELIHDRFPAYLLTGIDSDDDMLEAARKRLGHARFEKGDLTEWAPPAPAALLYANAVFQWLPGHMAVLNRLMESLLPGGTLAVQMPDNLDEPSHLIMEELARDERFSEFYNGRSLRRRLQTRRQHPTRPRRPCRPKTVVQAPATEQRVTATKRKMPTTATRFRRRRLRRHRPGPSTPAVLTDSPPRSSPLNRPRPLRSRLSLCRPVSRLG